MAPTKMIKKVAFLLYIPYHHSACPYVYKLVRFHSSSHCKDTLGIHLPPACSLCHSHSEQLSQACCHSGLHYRMGGP